MSFHRLAASISLVLTLPVCACSVKRGDPAEQTPAPTSSATASGSQVPSPVSVPNSLSCEGLQPVASEGRLLTRVQYQNTVRDLFDGIVQSDMTSNFPPENEAMGFGTNAQIHQATPLLADSQLSAAEDVSELVLGNLSALSAFSEQADCTQLEEQTDAEAQTCVEAFIDHYAFRAFRRPPTEGERQALVDLYVNSVPQFGARESMRMVIEAMLQAPQFLYRFESSGMLQDGVNAEVASDNEGAPLAERAVPIADYELASRLSYLLWNSMPDQTLFDLASQGALNDPAELESQARRMLDDGRAQSVLSDFHSQWLHLSALGSAVRELDPEAGPDDEANNLKYGGYWLTSLQLFINNVYTSDSPTLDGLLLTPNLYLNSNLAQLYGAQAGADATSESFSKVTLDSGERAGLLTQPALMALLAHPDQSAPVQRGVFIRDRILCQPPAPPPPTVNNTPPDPDPNLTTRQRFDEHTANPECAACHQLIDPIGLAFESFDQLGRYRSTENGLPVDVSGEVVGTRDTNLQGPFNGAVELSTRLAESPQVSECMAVQWYRYGMGRVEQDEDLCSLLDIRTAFEASGRNLKELLVAMVTTEAFRYRAVPEEQQ